MKNIISSTNNSALNDIDVIHQIKHQLNDSGWVLLRGFDASLPKFSELLKQFCNKLTFRQKSEGRGIKHYSFGRK